VKRRHSPATLGCDILIRTALSRAFVPPEFCTMRLRLGIITMAAMAALLAAGCTNPYDPTQRMLGGGLIGAGAGAAIGGMAGGGRGAAIGALAGGLGGAALGAATTPRPQAPYGGQPPYYAPPQPWPEAYAPTASAYGPFYPPPAPAYAGTPYPLVKPPAPGTYWQPEANAGGPYYAPPPDPWAYGYD
jgi:hypothetical protein